MVLERRGNDGRPRPDVGRGLSRRRFGVGGVITSVGACQVGIEPNARSGRADLKDIQVATIRSVARCPAVYGGIEGAPEKRGRWWTSCEVEGCTERWRSWKGDRWRGELRVVDHCWLAD